MFATTAIKAEETSRLRSQGVQLPRVNCSGTAKALVDQPGCKQLLNELSQHVQQNVKLVHSKVALETLGVAALVR